MRLNIAVLALLVGCDVLGGKSDTGSSGQDSGPVTNPGTGTQTTPQGSWAAHSHPCVGNRTDAMWWDDQQTVFVGCGTTTEGYGLYTSTDGGSSWSSVADARLGAFRVSSIQRANDGWLYVGGIDTLSAERVVRINAGGTIELVFEAGNQIWNSFHVGTFRRNGNGVAIAESLTGTGIVYRQVDGGPFIDGADWPTDGASYQILDMVLHNDAFYGVGSTIGTPPHVFLPDATDPLALIPVQLAPWAGEMWGVAVDASGVVAGGVNQDDNDGMVFVSGADPTDSAGYSSVNITNLVGQGPTWIRGVCRNGPMIAAVGEFSTTQNPILAVSEDGGATWQDRTNSIPAGASALHKCHIWPSGRMAITGQSGYLAIWNPA